MSEYMPLQSFNPGTASNTFQYTFAGLDPTLYYWVNFVVRSDAGSLVAYTPIRTSLPTPSPSAPDFSTSAATKHLSGGSIFLIVLSSLITVYVIAGLVMNKVKGRSGVDLLPNVEFWRSLPGLVADGYRFMTTCGASSYSAFQDDRVAASGAAAGAAPAGAAGPAETASYGATTRTGYGAI